PAGQSSTGTTARSGLGDPQESLHQRPNRLALEAHRPLLDLRSAAMTTRRFALNKTELTRLRREEKTYRQFLPVLQLKQEQLQIEQLKLKRQLAGREEELARARQEVERFAALFAESLSVPWVDLVKVEHIRLGEKSVAGVKVPVLEEVVFSQREYSRFGTPLWVSVVLPDLRTLVKQSTELKILRRQEELLTR